MFKAMNKYYEVHFNKIIEMKEMILKENIEIVCENSNGINIIVPGNFIETLIEEVNNNNRLLNNSKYYISSFSNKFINLSNVENNKSDIVEGSDENKYYEDEYFYRVYNNCLAKYDKLKQANEQLLNKIVEEKNVNRLYVLKPYLDQLKLESKAKNVTIEMATNIERLLSGLGIIARLDFIRNIQYIKTSKKNTNKNIHTETEVIINNMIGTIVQCLEKEYISKNIFDNLDMLNDTNILSHSNRVFISMVEFLYYYNYLFNKGLSNRLRNDYKNVYSKNYKRVLQNFKMNDIVDKLEFLFKLGIRKFSAFEILNYSIGTIYHDIAMLNIMDFVPTDDIMKDGNFRDFHTAKAYYFFKYFLNQKDECNLILGLHHECYGYGGGIMNRIINQKANDPKHKIDFLISFEVEDIINANVMAYFPAKMLEVVDIYDTLLFMGGSRSKNPEDVLLFMRKSFIDDKVKIDPIAFDLFLQFNRDIKGIDIIQDYEI